MKSLFNAMGVLYLAVCEWDVTGAERVMSEAVIREGFEWGGLDACPCIPAGSMYRAGLQTVIFRGEGL